MEYKDVTRVFNNPVKRNVIAALANEGPMTPKMLLQMLHSTSQATLYRAISSMEAEGLIGVVSEEKKRAMTEKTYDLSCGYKGIKDAIVRDNNGQAYCAMMGWSFHRLYTRFQAYAEKADIDIKRDATGYMEGKVRIDEGDLQDFFREIGEVMAKYSKKGEDDGKADHVVGVIVAPPEETI